MWEKSPVAALLGEREHDLLGSVDELGRLAYSLPAEPRDLSARTDEAAERRRLANDARVVGRVRSRRDERRELVDPRPAADVLELAALLELVDERDRVDRLALGPEDERGLEDAPVALAVEILRVEDLADGGDRAGREHHRAEDGLLGVDRLGRDQGCLECGHHVRTRD